VESNLRILNLITELMIPPASYSKAGFFKSVTFQRYNFLSFPPVAMYSPDGLMATARIYDSCALN
jgi:hypothetical protein